MSSKRYRVCLIVGTRPEVIKLAPVYFALRESSSLQPILLSTGQHRQLLDQALDIFGLATDADLGLMVPGQSLGELTSRAIAAVETYLKQSRPDAVIVQGDTSTVLASALAASYQRIPIGHVEAGLRTYDMGSPWPEEINRRLIAPLCTWNFAPTELARSNLLSERIDSERCMVTGNTVIDALLWMRHRLDELQESEQEFLARIRVPDRFIQVGTGLKGRKIVLLTLHRRESFGDGLTRVCEAIRTILENCPQALVVCPMHLNPLARSPIQTVLGNLERAALIEPLNYSDFVRLMGLSHFVISDSGGVQEEAPSLGKPVLVARETTERTEGVDAGTCRLVGTDTDSIVKESLLLLHDDGTYRSRSLVANPYGDGNASAKIRGALEAHFRQ